MEDWKYHQTYSGTPQGGIISPLLANIFLHRLDEFIAGKFKANQKQSKKEENARRNPEYQKIYNQITKLRRKLKETDKEGHKLIVEELKGLERQTRRTPYYDKNKKHPCKVRYVRYADDFVVLVAGTKEETETIRTQIKDELSSIGLSLSESKTKVTHWSKTVRFLGYEIKGKMKSRGVGIRAVLIIPQEGVRKVKDALEKVSGYYNIPEADVIAQMSAIFKGWCNYYRFASAPQPVFSKLTGSVWWSYAHYLARKQNSSIAKVVRRERKAGRLAEVQQGKRKRLTFQTRVGDKALTLNIFPHKTGQIRAVPNKQGWTVDLRPINPLNWQSGRSLATRLAAEDRAQGVCERCKARPIAHVHHTVPLRGKTFLARVMSDQSQRETAIALCKECHLEMHGGSFSPRKQRSSQNAGCIERCSSGVGSAS